MNPVDPLAGLQPLRQPELVGWWPPAPGWWLLLLLLAMLLVALTVFVLRRRRARAYRREGAAQLERSWQNYLADGDDARFITDTNALLKAVALRAYPDSQLARRHGDDWLQFLNSRVTGAAFEPAFARAVYAPRSTGVDAAQLRPTALHWIARHRTDP